MPDMGKTLGIGLIGVNNRARRVVLPGFAASPHSRVSALCSRTLDKARDAAADFEGVRAYAVFEDLLADPDVNTVFINTPNATHYRLTLQALAAGKHVVCEKPLSETEVEAEALYEAARRAGVRTAVNFTLRSLPGPRTVARLLSRGSIGTLLGFEVTTMQSRGFDPRYSRNDGLADLGPHLVDLLAWWADAAGAGFVVEVTAAATSFVDSKVRFSGQSPDNVSTHALIRLDGGATGFLGIVRVAHGFGNAYRALLFGSDGCIEMSFDTGEPRIRLGKGSGPLVEGGWQDISIPHDLAVSYADFPRVHFGRIAAAIAGAGEFPDFGVGLRAQRILDALSSSSRTSSWTPVRQP